MNLFREAILLFSLNLLDAVLTILWVRNGAAEEANMLMAKLLEMGDLTFLGGKLLIGTFAAIVFVRGGNTHLARYGISFAIAVYTGLMGIHLVTGVAALGMFSG